MYGAHCDFCCSAFSTISWMQRIVRGSALGPSSAARHLQANANAILWSQIALRTNPQHPWGRHGAAAVGRLQSPGLPQSCPHLKASPNSPSCARPACSSNPWGTWISVSAAWGDEPGTESASPRSLGCDSTPTAKKSYRLRRRPPTRCIPSFVALASASSAWPPAQCRQNMVEQPKASTSSRLL